MSVLYYNDSCLGWRIIFDAKSTDDMGEMWVGESLWIIPGTIDEE